MEGRLAGSHSRYGRVSEMESIQIKIIPRKMYVAPPQTKFRKNPLNGLRDETLGRMETHDHRRMRSVLRVRKI